MGGDLESNTKAPRSRLLLSCGESILAVAGSAYRRVEASRGAAGCLARAASRAAGPVLRPLRPTCLLSALSFADRRLAAAQGAAAALFPRAERALAKVDGFVLLVESIPARFDGAADGLEALVAGLRGGGGGAAGWACRDGNGGDGGDVFRDIRCVEGVSAGAGSQDAVTVPVDGGGDEDGGAGDEVKTISRVAFADEIGGKTQPGEEMERSDTGSDHLRPSSDEAGHDDEAAHTEEAEKQEAGSDEGEGEGGQISLDASGAGQRDEGVRMEQGGRSVDAATVAADGGGEDGGAGDEVKAISRAASSDDEITGEAHYDEEIERSDTGSDHLGASSDETGHDDSAAYREAARAEEAREQAGSDDGEGEEDQTDLDAPVAEQHDEGVQDGSSMEAAVEANAAEAMEAVKVESQQVASPDAGSAGETGEASGKKSSNDGDLLDLFDQAWQNVLLA